MIADIIVTLKEITAAMRLIDLTYLKSRHTPLVQTCGVTVRWYCRSLRPSVLVTEVVRGGKLRRAVLTVGGLYLELSVSVPYRVSAYARFLKIPVRRIGRVIV